MALAIVCGCFLSFPTADTEQSTASGSGNGPKAERQQLVQRKMNFKRRLCWVWAVSEGRGSRAGAPRRRRRGGRAAVATCWV